MRFWNFIITIVVLFILSSCNSIKEENYPDLTQRQMQYLVTVKFHGKVMRVPIYFKDSTIKVTKEVFFPEKWILPNTKKSEPAIPEFNKPTLTGLILTVSLQYNQADKKVILAGKYKYTNFSIPATSNLFLSGEEDSSYATIITPEITSRESSFYMIPVKLNKPYKVLLDRTVNPAEEFTILVSHRNKPIKVNL